MKLPGLITNKKILIILAICLLAGSFLIRPIKAAYDIGGASGDPFKEFETGLNDTGYNLPQFSMYNLNYLFLDFNRIFWGSFVEVAQKPGLIRFFANLIDETYINKPTSSGQYFAYLGQKLQIVKPAYAQGKGWQFLEPVLPIWKAVRDVTYLFSIVVLVVLGLMIMFRQKTDPQTTISVQAALSKIILVLVLITFSYAICGLIVDIAFFGNKLLGSIFKNVIKLAVIPPFGWDPDLTIFDFLGLYGSQIAKAGGGGISGKWIVDALWNMLQTLLKGLGGDLGPIISLVIGFAFISAIIKIFFSLLSRYVMLIIYTIFSPLLFLFGVIPGQADHISRFFKGFLTAAISFPATLLLLHLAGYFLVAGSQTPPMYLFETLPPFRVPLTPGQSFSQVIGIFICLGILMVASKLPESLDDALGVKASVAPSIGAEAAGVAKRIPVIGGLLG